MRELPSYLRVLDGGGEGESGPASSPFGPLKVGLIQSRITQDQALSELLNDLERRIDELRFRFFTVLDTLNTDTDLLALQNLSFLSEDGMPSTEV
jgi:hypothetical protein